MRGAAAVEFAVILPLLLMILFGILEFGRILYVNQALSWAAREGARVAALPGTTNTIVSDVVNEKLTESGVPVGTIVLRNEDPDKDWIITDLTNTTQISPNDPVKVIISVNYEDVAYVSGFIKTLQGKKLSGVAVMRKS